MWIFRSVSLLFSLIGILITTATVWFVPWVLTFHLGVLVYFPYQPKSEERFMRITGPWAGSYKKNWVPGENIPKACKLALVAAEDTKFFIHHGIDLESLEKSYEYNKRKKSAKRGGSTITQQLVKNAFLSRERSYIRKAREIVGAVLLDATASKDMQLNWYFNIVEFGPNVYGIKDAAQFYFNKSPAALSQRECASLVAILPSPNKWNKSLKAGAPSGFLSARVSTIIARMKVIPTEEVTASRGSTLASSKKKPTDRGGQTADTDTLNDRLPPLPEPGAGDPLTQAELQAEKAEEINLPEDTGEESGQWGTYELGKESWVLDEKPAEPQELENTDTNEP